MCVGVSVDGCVCGWVGGDGVRVCGVVPRCGCGGWWWEGRMQVWMSVGGMCMTLLCVMYACVYQKTVDPKAYLKCLFSQLGFLLDGVNYQIVPVYYMDGDLFRPVELHLNTQYYYIIKRIILVNFVILHVSHNVLAL